MKSRFDQFIKEVQEQRSREFKVPSEELWLKINKRLKRRKRLRLLYTFFALIGISLLIGSYVLRKNEISKVSLINMDLKHVNKRKLVGNNKHRLAVLKQLNYRESVPIVNTMKDSFISGSKYHEFKYPKCFKRSFNQNSSNRNDENDEILFTSSTSYLNTKGNEITEVQFLKETEQKRSITFNKIEMPKLKRCSYVDHNSMHQLANTSKSNRFSFGLSTGIIVPIKSFDLSQNNLSFTASNYKQMHTHSWQTNFDLSCKLSEHIVLKSGVGYGVQNINTIVNDELVAYDTLTEMLSFYTPISIISVSTSNLLVDKNEDHEDLELEPDDSSMVLLSFINKSAVSVISVPIQLGYELKFNRLKCSIYGGLNISFLKDARTEISTMGFISPNYSIQNNLAKFSMATKLNIGFDYTFSDSFAITSTIGYQQAMTPYFKVSSATVKPLLFGINAGLKYNF